MEKNMQARRCWPVLLIKANQVLTEAASTLTQVRQQYSALTQQREKVDRMLGEYLERHKALTAGDHYISESLAIQRFMAQLSLMKDRIDAEARRSESSCRNAAAALNAAQAEVSKFGKLIDLESSVLRDTIRQAEARTYDEIALLRFNAPRR